MSADNNYASTIRIDLLLNNRENADSNTHAPLDTHRMETLVQHAPTSDFEILLQSVYDAALLTDFDGRVTNANERALRFFGYTADTITNCDISELIAGADTSILETVIRNVHSERFTLLQAHCMRRDDSLFPAEIAVTCLKLATETSLCFFIRDIHIRREMEKQLNIEHNAVQNAGSGIAITNLDGIISYANPAMCNLWKHKAAHAFPETPIQELFCQSADLDTAIAQAAAARTWNGELKACRQDGTPFFLLTSVTSCTDEDNNLTHFVFSFVDTTQRRLDEEALRLYQDHLEDLIRERTSELQAINNNLKREIDERQQVEKDLREAIKKLREHDQAKNMFVSNVSHELRTPLTALIHALESLMRGVIGPVSDAVLSYLTMMLEDCWRLDRTVCDILDLSRIEAGRLALRTANVPFRHMVERAAESLRMEAEEIPLHLDIKGDGNNGFVDCDSAKMERVIINIINNAIKFTPAGGNIQVQIDTHSQDGISGICCRITDNGVGIAAAYIDRVTERFFRVGEQVGGTGLGLAIAKEIIERHKGTLEITSPPPGKKQGTEVSFWLPVTVPQHVMIVSSNQPTIRKLTALLASCGYAITSEPNAQNALQVLRDGQHHLVIVDAEIPDMDGSEIVMHMKADTMLRQLPVFLLTEKHPEPARSSILASFNIPILIKSDTMQDVIATVQNAFLSKRVGVQELQSTSP
jgi:PAS domain S-box-containing protein